MFMVKRCLFRHPPIIVDYFHLASIYLNCWLVHLGSVSHVIYQTAHLSYFWEWNMFLFFYCDLVKWYYKALCEGTNLQESIEFRSCFSAYSIQNFLPSLPLIVVLHRYIHNGYASSRWNYCQMFPFKFVIRLYVQLNLIIFVRNMRPT